MSPQHHRPTARPSDRDARRSPWATRALAAGAAVALTVGVAVLSLGAGIATAGPALTQPSGNQIELSVNPSNGLPATNAEITVRGSGFDPGNELWVAVCQDDGVAPASFAHCLGGAIPNANASSSWAVLTRDGKPRYAGPVTGTLSKRGAFKITLQVAVASGQDADCVSENCSVYTRSADPSNRSQDASVRVGFSFTGPSKTTASVPSTEVIGAAPTTVAPDSVLSADVPVGSDQVVVFSGFTPGEVVDATLYSDPIPLPPVQASPNGMVKISFTVPPDLPLGAHLVQAIGRQSARVGVAQFTVVAVDAPATTTGTDATTADTTATSMTESSSLASSTGAGGVAPVTTAPTPASAALTTDTAANQTADDAVATAPADGNSGGIARLVWLWVVLGALVVIGGAAAFVAMMRRRGGHASSYADERPVEPVTEVILAPSWQQTPGQSTASADSAGWPRYPEPPDALVQPRDPGPSTEQWQPVFGPGPATEQWQPISDRGPATEQWRPVFDNTVGGSGSVDGSGGAARSGGSDSSDSSDESDEDIQGLYPDGGWHRDA
ncbi:MAG: hypothetical protein ABI382_07620 [Nakamurella sp.]